jgi:hypothetical protein
LVPSRGSVEPPLNWRVLNALGVEFNHGKCVCGSAYALLAILWGSANELQIFGYVGAVNIWTKNVLEILNEFLFLIQVSSIKEMKIQVLNLKKPKTQVSIGYLTLKFIK